jgi:hypothetical protein
MSIDQHPRVIRFGSFEADLHAGELRKNGTKVRLPNQPFQVLAMLLAQPGDVVTRAELQKRLAVGPSGRHPFRCRSKKAQITAGPFGSFGDGPNRRG